MKLKLTAIAILFACLFVNKALFAQADTAVLNRLSEYQLNELSNGLKIITVQNSSSEYINYRLIVDFPAILQESSTGHIDFTALTLGAKFTSRTQMVKEMVSDPKDLDTTLHFMADFVLKPDFERIDIEQFKLKMRTNAAFLYSDIDSLTYILGNKLLFSEQHPYSEFITEQSINAVTIRKAKDFYNQIFKPGDAYLVVVGNFETDSAVSSVTRYFSRWQTATAQETNYTVPEIDETKVKFIDIPDADRTRIEFTHTFATPENFTDFFKVQIASQVLSLTVKEAIDNQASLSEEGYSKVDIQKNTSSIFIKTKVDDLQTAIAVRLLNNEFKNFVNQQPTDEKVSTVTNQIVTDFAFAVQEPQYVANLAYNLVKYELPKNYYNDYEYKVSNFTASDVQNVASRYFNPGACWIVIAGNKKRMLGKVMSLATDWEINSYDHNLTFTQTIPKGFGPEFVFQNYVNAVKKSKFPKQWTVGFEAKYIFTDRIVDVDAQIYRKQPDLYALKMILKLGQDTSFVLKFKTFFEKVYYKLSSKDTLMVVIQKFDGKSGIEYSKQGTYNLEDQQLIDIKCKAVYFPELYYEEWGFHCEIAGLDTLNGKDVYKIEIQFPDNLYQYDYFQMETGFKVKTEKYIKDGENMTLKETTLFRNYKPLSKEYLIFIPRTIEIIHTDYSLKMKILDFDTKTKIKNSLFDVDKSDNF